MPAVVTQKGRRNIRISGGAIRGISSPRADHTSPPLDAAGCHGVDSIICFGACAAHLYETSHGRVTNVRVMRRCQSNVSFRPDFAHGVRHDPPRVIPRDNFLRAALIVFRLLCMRRFLSRLDAFIRQRIETFSHRRVKVHRPRLRKSLGSFRSKRWEEGHNKGTWIRSGVYKAKLYIFVERENARNERGVRHIRSGRCVDRHQRSQCREHSMMPILSKAANIVVVNILRTAVHSSGFLFEGRRGAPIRSGESIC